MGEGEEEIAVVLLSWSSVEIEYLNDQLIFDSAFTTESQGLDWALPKSFYTTKSEKLYQC